MERGNPGKILRVHVSERVTCMRGLKNQKYVVKNEPHYYLFIFSHLFFFSIKLNPISGLRFDNVCGLGSVLDLRSTVVCGLQRNEIRGYILYTRPGFPE